MVAATAPMECGPWAAIVGLVICALVLYGVAPAVLDVLDEWPQVVDIEPYWFVAMIVAQVGQLGGPLAAAAPGGGLRTRGGR